MSLYKIEADSLNELPKTTFAATGIKERGDLQRFLRDQIDVIADDTMVISEEFSFWDDSRRRIDLLAIDKHANVVVIELKRTNDGGHMELQAVRYAAMVSNLTFAKAVHIFSSYLEKRSDERDAEQTLLEFLEWDEPDEDAFAADVRIVLASAEFSKELTSSVLWLAEYGIDIRCVRLLPYSEGDKVLLDVQQVIPLPEATDFQISVREKKQQERTSRRSKRDLTKFIVIVGKNRSEHLPKRRAILAVVKALSDTGVSLDEMASVIDWRTNFVLSAEGDLNAAQLTAALESQKDGSFDARRWFLKDEELIHAEGQTYTLSSQWGNSTAKAMRLLLEHFNPQDISFEKAT